jgi:hypothetical protein
MAYRRTNLSKRFAAGNGFHDDLNVREENIRVISRFVHIVRICMTNCLADK